MIEKIKPISVGDITISSCRNTIMAGPDAIESENQTFTIAQAVVGLGAQILRGGAFKPRTSPESFQGHGIKALRILFQAGRTFNVPVITEVMDPRQIPIIKKVSDGHPFIFQIGTRNAQNYSLLKSVGKTGIPVLLKRGKGSSVKEMLGAAKYVMNGGSPVIMCERGIETFSSASGTGRFTFDQMAIGVFHEHNFFCIADANHAPGARQYVLPTGRAAIAFGADGLIVEVGLIGQDGKCHALCDADQAISADEFGLLVKQSRQIENIIKNSGKI